MAEPVHKLARICLVYSITKRYSIMFLRIFANNRRYLHHMASYMYFHFALGKSSLVITFAFCYHRLHVQSPPSPTHTTPKAPQRLHQ